MKRLLSIGVLLVFVRCTNEDGHRCNPLRATSDCDPGFSCVYPTGPNCGVSYCCAVDSTGRIVDNNPNCQPDPASAAACDMGATVGDAATD
jgi:hypothetical protein